MAAGYKIEGAKNLQLHHFYRAMAWIGSPLSGEEPPDGEIKTPRCIKDKIEEKIFNQRRDIFTGMDLVFFDTTSIYFEGQGGETIGWRGHSKDSRSIFHKCDETIRGHVFCSFLALVLRKGLDMDLERAGQRLEWEDIKIDLKALQETRIEENGKRISVRSRIQGCCGKVFAAVGVALPPTLKVS